MTKKVTITDLARRANVSVTTVSQILNGKDDRFSDKTVKKIHQLQKEMGYVPDFNAQSLIRRSGRTIGVLVPNINNPFFSHFLRGIESVAMENGYIPLIFGSNNNQKLESYYLFESIRRAADGMIIASAISDVSYIDNILNQNGIPYLLTDQAPVAEGDQVDVNNYHGGEILANYLIQKGHQKVAVVTDQHPTLNLKQRLAGFLDTFKSHQLSIPADRIIETELTKLGGYHVTDQVLKMKSTAIFALNDELAIGLYRGIHEAGLKIPDDISIVGYDDIDLTEYVTPTLTTIHQPSFEMGASAARLILARIQDRHRAFQRVALPISLVERQSVKTLN